jgi:hypothetical protein
MGPPQRQAVFDIYFDSGIADYASWLKVLKENDIIKQAGAYYKYDAFDDQPEQQFQSKDFVQMMTENKKLRDYFYNKICDAVIMKYKDPNSKIVEDAIVSEEEETESGEE